MQRTLTAIFDGQVLRPESTLDLEPNTRYIITVQEDTTPPSEGDVWDLLERLAGTVEAPHDWSAEHDHYLYGTPKKYTDPAV